MVLLTPGGLTPLERGSASQIIGARQQAPRSCERYSIAMSRKRDQLVREIAKFPGHLTIAAACLIMDAAVEVPPALVESIEAFNDAVAPVLCDENRMQEVMS